jgi:hypothetical protein
VRRRSVTAPPLSFLSADRSIAIRSRTQTTLRCRPAWPATRPWNTFMHPKVGGSVQAFST